MCVVVSYGPPNVLPLARTPNPVAVPDTCEPWPLQSSGFGSGVRDRRGVAVGRARVIAVPDEVDATLDLRGQRSHQRGVRQDRVGGVAAAYSAGVATVPGARKCA